MLAIIRKFAAIKVACFIVIIAPASFHFSFYESTIIIAINAIKVKTANTVDNIISKLAMVEIPVRVKILA